MSFALDSMNTRRAVKMASRIIPAFAAILTAMLLSGESSACAAAPIIKINPSTDVPDPYWGADEGHGDNMVGWTFQLLVPFTVTQVGWYDENTSNGLSRAFRVGLWEGQGIETDPGTPHTIVSSSLIGDPNHGLVIPEGTNAALLGVWRVVDLTSPLTLQPGFYELGGLDTSTTTDVIKYVSAGNPGVSPLTPPGSPLVIGEFFFAGTGTQTNFGPTTNFYSWWGLELGPMLFGTNPPAIGSDLEIRLFPFNVRPTPGVLLTWPTGTLQQADVIAGPYNAVSNAASPYLIRGLSLRKFYRLGP